MSHFSSRVNTSQSTKVGVTLSGSSLHLWNGADAAPHYGQLQGREKPAQLDLSASVPTSSMFSLLAPYALFYSFFCFVS